MLSHSVRPPTFPMRHIAISIWPKPTLLCRSPSSSRHALGPRVWRAPPGSCGRPGQEGMHGVHRSPSVLFPMGGFWWWTGTLRCSTHWHRDGRTSLAVSFRHEPGCTSAQKSNLFSILFTVRRGSPSEGTVQRLGDYSATSMIGVRWKPARRRRPVQNPPQFSIPQPAAIRAIIPLPLPSPQSLDTPSVARAKRRPAISRRLHSVAKRAGGPS